MDQVVPKKRRPVDSPAYGTAKITEKGLKVLNDNPGRIDLDIIKSPPNGPAKKPPGEGVLDPVETIMNEHAKIESMLKDDLLRRVKNLSPRGFELAVLDLCKKMDNRADVVHTGKPGDGGVDGIIHDSKFGLSKIYVQAKKHSDHVSKGQVMEFIAAVSGKATMKGIFITTAEIPESARREVRENKTVSIRLVDGNELAELMMEYNVGVAIQQHLEIKKIDEGYFSDRGSKSSGSP